MKIEDEGRTRNPNGIANCYDAPVFEGIAEIPVFHMAHSDTFWYMPINRVDLTVGQKVIVRSHDGSGQYAHATVLKKERGIEGCPNQYEIG